MHVYVLVDLEKESEGDLLVSNVLFSRLCFR